MSSSDETEETDEYRRAELKAMRLLGRRGHATGELERKLSERGFSDSVIEEVCEELKERGDLDDRRFAVYQGEILLRKNWGPRQIRAKLRKRGVDDEIIDHALLEIADDGAWLSACYERATSKYGSEPEDFDRSTVERAYRHLDHRGFRASTIRRVLLDGARPEDADSSGAQ
ncbi:MAG: regulatory protein RecX [Bradymonadaceae bacterium]